MPAATRKSLLTSTLPLLFLLLPRVANACGGLFCEPQRPVVQRGESIVFGVENNVVTMQVQILYEGPAEAFSWVLPLPFQPSTVDVGSDLLFRSLFRQSLPTFELEIQNEASATCSSNALEPVQCFASDADDVSEENDGVILLDEGSVGPYDFVILQAEEKNPNSVLAWLEENGYAQPEGSASLLNYYATNDHVFVAVRLTKEADTGDIQPLILTYEMPENTTAQQTTQTVETAGRMAMACVPIQLTSVAATDDMPIQVYILGSARAVPLNFVELELDDTLVDWLTCQNNPGCYDDDYRERFDLAASQLANHSFVTEYAGPTTSVITDSIAVQFTAEEVAAVSSWEDFQMFQPFLPNLTIVDAILQKHSLENFNAAELAEELEEKVLEPSREAQAFVEKFPYLTRLYARLSPETMTKDPFFAFKPELPDVSNVHRAVAVPICQDGNPSALSISVQDGAASVELAATMGCFGWMPADPVEARLSISPARQLASWGFAGDEGIIVQRSVDGAFDMTRVQEALAFGDSLVTNQTIPEYDTQATLDAPTEIPVPSPNTEAPTSNAQGVSAFAPILAGFLLYSSAKLL